ncbi:hypothetical protein BKA56DRAFT_674462 [Ilyonectria sp. MPI-CAGE-AT-0026]|nr:hypothetical protein BKA56DRAFT_674462 [Ilyonectria sp. MPI-CAGE-AT-0026]
MSQRMKDMMQKGKDLGKEKGTAIRNVKPKGTIRGKAAGMVGLQRKGSDDDHHVARPISQLRDPSQFAPPPKRTGSGLLPAPPPTKAAARQVITAPSKYQDPRAAPVEPPKFQKQLEAPPQEEEEPQEEEDRPPQPYRVNTTGLATNHLPPPPGRKDGADGRGPPLLPPPSYQSATTGSKPPPPSLPPRLPPRTNSGSSTASAPPVASPASTGSGYLNQGAISRLGAAGVSVPGFGIGRSSPANQDDPGPPQPPRPGAAPPAPSQMNELQNRFSRLGASSAPPAASPPPSEGTTWAQKQAAMKTASAFHKDPSSVSFSDAKAAAGTANNFRQRHGEQVASGVKTANSLNQKYGLMNKVESYTGSHNEHDQVQGTIAPSPVPGLAGKKKPPPPPPPKKKPGLGNASAVSSAPAGQGPPPVPMSTRPQFE